VTAPAGAGEATWQLHEAADLVVIPHRPARHRTVEDFYDEFSDVTDSDVFGIVQRWVNSRPQQQIGVKTINMKPSKENGQLLACEIDLPPGVTRGGGPYPTVIFAHGYESDGRSPRTVPISQRLAKRGIIGVRPDFTGHGRSEGDLEDASDQRMYNDLKIIYNNVRQLHEVNLERMALAGSGTGGMLVLNLAVEDPSVKAVVVRGPMSGKEIEAAAHVKAPTLLIYAEQDAEYARSDKELRGELRACHEILEIQDATRLFTDAISREMMVGATVDWLVDHLEGRGHGAATG
jgi:dienelactone hydrolase